MDKGSLERELLSQQEALKQEYLAAGQALQMPYEELQAHALRTKQQLEVLTYELSTSRQTLGAELQAKEEALVSAHRDLAALQVRVGLSAEACVSCLQSVL
jgi:hypothetical protein